MLLIQQDLLSYEQWANVWSSITFNGHKCLTVLFEGNFAADREIKIYIIYGVPRVVVDSF